MNNLHKQEVAEELLLSVNSQQSFLQKKAPIHSMEVNRLFYRNSHIKKDIQFYAEIQALKSAYKSRMDK